MIDTAELTYLLSADEARYVIYRLMHLFPQRSAQLLTFLQEEGIKYGPPIYGNQINGLNPGLQAITMYRKYSRLGDLTGFQLAITLALEPLCQHKPTVELFTPSATNIRYLQAVYAESILLLFPKAFERRLSFTGNGTPVKAGLGTLPYLGMARVREIAFSTNCFSENPEATLQMIQNSFCCSRKEQCDYGNENLYAKNKSSTYTAYNKARKYEETYCPSEALLEEAQNIIRLEYTKIRPSPSAWIEPHCNLQEGTGKDYCGLLPFLDNNMSENELFNVHKQCIGTSNWYNDHYYTKRINGSNKHADTKATMLKAGHVASKCRNLTTAKHDWEKGCTVRGKEYLGNISFDQMRQHFNKIDTQMLRIPDNMAKEHKLKSLENPIKKIVLAGCEHYDELPKMVELSLEDREYYEATVEYLLERNQQQKM